MDGVDGVIIDENCQKIITSAYLPYPDFLKTKLAKISQSGKSSLKDLAQLDIEVAGLFAKVANQLLTESKIDKSKIQAIGSHGQTIYHQGSVYSMQIGHGAIIAEQTGITTVADFRMQDVAAGGQGAPLTPAYHQYMLNSQDGIIINLGGISNITIIDNGVISGFDTGPANTLMDAWVKQQKNLDYDKDGNWARSGTLDEALLGSLIADDYFQQLPPKSTGPEYFNIDWLTAQLSEQTSADIQRTLLEFTAVSISQHIPNAKTDYLCGGGVHNSFLLERLSTLNPNSKITTTTDLGIHPDFVEAAAFAYFASQTLQNKPTNLPSVTGAKGKRILGAVYSIKP
ncbi:Anhydro-N-acetylmuramic acid kinase [uncultured Candidatus Thioglobus sp.]|nr:Anhydro-N-acetylmuramic acid kinase [uncultured Candidatus Thioglobus sp.]